MSVSLFLLLWDTLLPPLINFKTRRGNEAPERLKQAFPVTREVTLKLPENPVESQFEALAGILEEPGNPPVNVWRRAGKAGWGRIIWMLPGCPFVKAISLLNLAWVRNLLATRVPLVFPLRGGNKGISLRGQRGVQYGQRGKNVTVCVPFHTILSILAPVLSVRWRGQNRKNEERDVLNERLSFCASKTTRYRAFSKPFSSDKIELFSDKLDGGGQCV